MGSRQLLVTTCSTVAMARRTHRLVSSPNRVPLFSPRPSDHNPRCHGATTATCRRTVTPASSSERGGSRTTGATWARTPGAATAAADHHQTPVSRFGSWSWSRAPCSSTSRSTRRYPRESRRVSTKTQVASHDEPRHFDHPVTIHADLAQQAGAGLGAGSRSVESI